jgi:hypothetical protein
MALSVVGVVRGARADEGDGAYGRLDGDVLFIGSLGPGIEAGGVFFETHVALLYLQSVGPYVRYTEGFGQDELRIQRSVGLGFEGRPLFLARYALDLEKGPPHLDLFADSFALIAGLFWSAPGPVPGIPRRERGELQLEPGLELGVGLEVPILPTGNGPFVGVQALARFPGDYLVGRSDADFLDRGSATLFTLAWHQAFDANLVDVGDRPTSPRTSGSSRGR